MENNTIPNYTTQDLRVTPAELEAVVIDIKVSTAGKIYGETAKNKDQEVFVLLVENKEYAVQTEQTIPKYPSGNVPDSSKLGKFIKRYGKFECGMQVKLEKNIEGFWRLRL